jgi:hypothetical protein
MTDQGGSAYLRSLGGAIGQKLLPLSSTRLCAEARRRAGLQDFGSPDLEPALSILVSSLEAEAQLHPLGRLLMRIHLQELLENRLRFNAAWPSDFEDLNRLPIQRPVFIVGIPRSGSTFLHELMAEDPANRAPRVWEVMFPISSRQEGDREQRRRIRKTETCLWWFRRLARKADSVYPMRASTPHECVALHSYTFLSEEFVSTCRVPTYEKFLRSADRRQAYAWQKRFLQALQYSCEPKRWILKSPDHVRSLEELFSVFPDAAIIQTHRNPVQVLRSSTELTRVLQGLYAWPGDMDHLAAREARMLAEGTEQFIRFRDDHPELANRFIDLKYTDLISDPLAEVTRIYRHLDFVLSEAAVLRMRQLASQRSRYEGVRQHSTQRALTRMSANEERHFERYCARFGLST